MNAGDGLQNYSIQDSIPQEFLDHLETHMPKITTKAQRTQQVWCQWKGCQKVPMYAQSLHRHVKESHIGFGNRYNTGQGGIPIQTAAAAGPLTTISAEEVLMPPQQTIPLQTSALQAAALNPVPFLGAHSAIPPHLASASTGIPGSLHRELPPDQHEPPDQWAAVPTPLVSGPPIAAQPPLSFWQCFPPAVDFELTPLM